jgi:MFS family permease
MSALAALRRRPGFVLLWAGQATSLFGSLVGGFAYILTAILALHASPVQIAVLNGCTLLPVLLAGPFAGVWVDRLRRRPLLIAADAGRALVLGTIPAAALLGLLTMTQLYLVALAVSALGILFEVSFNTYLPGVVGEDELVHANSVFQGTEAVAEAAGNGLGGVLVQAFGGPAAIALDALSFVVSAVSLGRVRAPDAVLPRSRDQRRTALDLAAGWQAVRADPVVLSLTIATAIWEMAGNAVGVVVTLFFLRDLHLQPLVIGPLVGIGGLSAFGGAVLAGRVVRRLGVRWSLIGSLYVDAAGIAAIVVAGGPLPMILLFMVLSQCTDGGRSIYEITVLSLLQQRPDAGTVGRVIATFETVKTAGMVGGLLAGGVLGAAIGLRGTLAVALAAKLLVPLVLLRAPLHSEERVEGVAR